MTRNQLLEMFPTGPAIPDGSLYDPVSAIAGGVGVVGNLIGGIMGSGAASNAANIEKQAGQQGAQDFTQATQYAQQNLGANVPIANQYLTGAGSTSQSLYNPYLALGNQGASTLSQMMQPGGQLAQQFSFNPNNAAQVAASPEYQFALQQGTAAVNQNAATQGLLNSGGTLKGLMSYGQGLASQQYQNAYNNSLQTYQTNYGNTLNSLGMLTGVGQNATNSLTGQNLSLAQMMSGNTMNAAQQSGNWALQGAQGQSGATMQGAAGQAAGVMGSANAWSNALSGIGNSAIGSAGLYNMNQMMSPSGGTFMPYSQGNTWTGLPAANPGAAFNGLPNATAWPTYGPTSLSSLGIPGLS